MEWKAIITQGFLTLVAVVVGVKFVGVDNTHQIEALQESILAQIQSLEIKIEDTGAVVEDQNLSSLTASARPARPAGIELKQSLQTMNQSIQDIADSLVRLEDAIGAGFPPPPPLQTDASSEKDPLQRQSEQQMPGAWIQNLSENKRIEVEDIFRWHSESLRASFPGGLPSDPKTLIEVMEKSNQELNENLKAVLSEDEYLKFMDSLPNARNAQSSPDITKPGS